MARAEEREGIQQQPLEPEASLGDRVKLAGAFAAGAALVLFLLQNLQEVDVNFLWMEWHIQMVAALVAAAILGALTTMLIGFFRRRSHDAAMRQQVALERARKK
jgi:uncharacterized integral membrane protein